jgi:endonuclease/exonuclease/phosphatase (EEP) superfamily protein YafD
MELYPYKRPVFTWGATPLASPQSLSGGPAAPESIGGTTLRVLNWNVHKETGAAFRADMRRLLEGYRPDVLSLQEARCDGEFTSILETSGTLSWTASPNLTMHEPAGLAGVLTASRARPSMSRPMLSRHTEPILRTPKSMLACEYPLRTGGSLLVLNIHSLNFRLGMGMYRDQLESLLACIGTHQGPIILAGDFNTWSGRRMEYLMARTHAAGLRRVDFKENRTAVGWGLNLALDHVFYSTKNLRVRPGSAEQLGFIRTSDHFPFFVEFEILSDTSYTAAFTAGLIK